LKKEGGRGEEERKIEEAYIPDPVSTGTTVAPSMRMRKTLSDWRLQSSPPMYTMQLMPMSAHAVAVATPCWPAPVSQMIRFLPRRCMNTYEYKHSF